MPRGGRHLDLEEFVVSLQESGVELSDETKQKIYDLDVHSYTGLF